MNGSSAARQKFILPRGLAGMQVSASQLRSQTGSGVGLHLAARYQCVPIQQEAIKAATGTHSVVHMYLQPRRVPKRLVPGAPKLPQNPSGNPIYPAVAPACPVSGTVVNRFRKRPGALVS